ncbi:methylated-DNA--[protein]-cysteine S-methyltransferase [Botrimarina hoheduenensis]|uniref:Methylated-DNA--protein-cysteine methyltransferase n=1 Tax=Botrimarina hoheduenensis TaxID=2528000 RepID=A0A5C5W8K8_9BACT|nr:methylated-DNA--[protein]-cysteine S-methyltransferase [Botrimarina hoheduenensis]TWT47228.1 Methylated-DNA--protein-cysteine methyltransferase [Botrimarina hoheduenensis]
MTDVLTAPRLVTATIATPLGVVHVASDGEALRMLEFDDEQRRTRQLSRLAKRLHAPISSGTDPVIQNLEAELTAYFSGVAAPFATRCELTGTPFQLRVWRQLRRIPIGQTRSYAAIAAAIGQPQAVRAVGAANGANPISILVPCHRVINTGGALGGYGGGLERKRWLLEHERGLSQQTLFA